MKRPKIHQFTLVELMVAMAIFVVMMLVLATMLNDTIQLSRKRKSQSDFYQHEQVLSSIFSRDIENMVASSDENQPIYFIFARNSASFFSTSLIGVDQTTIRPSPLNAVMYQWDQDSQILYRATQPFPMVNATYPPPLFNKEVIARRVKSFSILGYSQSGELSWKLYAKELPVFVRIQMTFHDEYDSDASDADKEATRTYQKHIFIHGSKE